MQTWKALSRLVSSVKSTRLPAKAPRHPWQWPSRPWGRIHIDYAGPIKGKMILVIVDAHSSG